MPNEITESPAGSLSGWTRLKYSSGNERYRHDETGIELSARKFFDQVSKWKGQGYAPVEDIRAAAGISQRIVDSTIITTPDDSGEPTSSKEYIQPKLNPKLGTRPTPGGFKRAIPHANNYRSTQPTPQSLHRGAQSRARYEEEDDPVTRLAADSKPRPRDGRSSHTRPTAAALSIGINRLVLLITNVIVFRILEDERAKLTEQETTALGIALGNLLEPTKFNEQWGWMIAEAGDWQTIGYILVMYFSRIGDVVREKQQSRVTNFRENNPKYS
jgi:hypothetical protein